MEDRYQVKEKIGQGGLGSVYRAFDTRMQRDVAIKRIITSKEDATLSEEATRQLIKEAGALAALQHPNIVTIYDVGSDQDGPFVVMELLSGSTIEDLISKGSFTWADFRQLALQTMEALIAAQELHLVHRDLKPTNIMVVWLPSGKFQVKIVDFGLAKLSAKPTLQTIDQKDGVFGSIYFMAPEQFERVPLDQRADLYAIACVFYYVLTGTYPFDGDTAAAVMVAHLQHHVTPLQDVREGIPTWACDWIMWHLNRMPSDRPNSARESLQVFLENDEVPYPQLSVGPSNFDLTAAPVGIAPNVKSGTHLPHATSSQYPLKTASVPVAISPPTSTQAKVATTGIVIPTAAVQKEPPVSVPPTVTSAPKLKVGAPKAEEEVVAEPAVVATSILKRSTSNPPTGRATPALKSKLNTSPNPKSTAAPQVTNPNSDPAFETKNESAKSLPPKPTNKLSNQMKLVIAGVSSVLILILSIVILDRSKKSAINKVYNDLITQATRPGADEVFVDKDKLDLLLTSVADTGANTNRDALYTALLLAKGIDGTKVDSVITEFATNKTLIPNVRVVLLRDVLGRRKSADIVNPLVKYALSEENADFAQAAIQGTRSSVEDVHLDLFLDIIKTSKQPKMVKEAEASAIEIAKNSKKKPAIANQLASIYSSLTNDNSRHSILRVIANCGGAKAKEIVQKNLESDNEIDQIAAISALAKWGDKEGFQILLDFLDTSPALTIRTRTFESALSLITEAEKASETDFRDLNSKAKTQEEQSKIIRAIVSLPPSPWSYEILKSIKDTSNFKEASSLAERGIKRLELIEKEAAKEK